MAQKFSETSGGDPVAETPPDSKTLAKTVAKTLAPAAARALAEAEERRRRSSATERPRELHGRDGPDPARYGDWEVKGIISDF